MSTNSIVAVIGGGPAGLSAAVALSKLGFEPIVFEKGKHHKNRSLYQDLCYGIGGCGLFSDGKFSYHPSGTNLYKIRPEQMLLE